jgi:hypothetical protein
VAETLVPKLVLRPEYDEWGLLERHPDLYDAVLLKDSYTTPYHKDHPHFGRDAGRLRQAIPSDREFWCDPDTAGLVSQSSIRLRPTARLRETALSQAFDLPLDLAMFAEDPGLRDLAVDLVLESQSGSATRTPPYFDVDSRGGTALQLNLQMLRRTVAAVGDEVPMAVLQVTRHRLMTGVVEEVAGDYARAGLRRVVLRVRGFESQAAQREELNAYLDAVVAFEPMGSRPELGSFGRCRPLCFQ